MCFALQTSGLCSAFPSLPVNFFHVCVLFYSDVYYACFASQTSCLCIAFLLLPAIFWQGLFCFLRQISLCVLCLSSNCLCSISKFPRLRLNVYVPLFFPLYYLVKRFVMRAFPRELRFLFPAPLICTLYLLFVILFWYHAYRSFPRLFFVSPFSHGDLKGCLMP